MMHSTYTQQSPSSFKLNQTLIADAPHSDEQAAAQVEIDNHIETQALSVAPTKDPLTARDRRIIAEIVQAQPETIGTIWIEGGITVWVQFTDGGRLPLDRDCFTTRVAEVKATLPETPRKRNERLNTEQTCSKFGLWYGQVDWLSSSTKLSRDKDFLGFVGCTDSSWYGRRYQYSPNQKADSAETAITSLGAKVAVTA